MYRQVLEYQQGLKSTLALIAIFIGVVLAPAQATTLNVPGQYATMDAAYAAANDGDTINVAAGTYVWTSFANTVNDTKALTIQGCQADNDAYIRNPTGSLNPDTETIIYDGATSTGGNTPYLKSVENLTFNGVMFDYASPSTSSGQDFVLDFTSGSSTVPTPTFNNITVKNCIFRNGQLQFAGTGHNINVSHNLFISTVSGQHQFKLAAANGPLTNVVVDQNYFIGGAQAMPQGNASPTNNYPVDLTLTDNVFQGCAQGLNMAHLDAPTITGNTFTGCTYGAMIGSQDDGVVSGNTFSGNTGIGLYLFGPENYNLWPCSGLSITGNAFTSNSGRAVSVDGGVGPNTSVTGNTFSGNGTTIQLGSEVGYTTLDTTNVLYPNTVTDTGIGLDIAGITTDLSLGAMSFPSTLTQYIVLETGTTANVDASAATFGSLTGAQMNGIDRAALENKIYDKLDNAALGLVSVLPSSVSTVYVDATYTSATGGWGFDHFNTIQGGVNAVTVGGTVIVAAGVYTDSVPTKAVTIRGAQHGVDANTRHSGGGWSSAGETLVHSQSNIGTVNGMTFDGLMFDSSNNREIYVSGPLNNFTVTNCIFQNGPRGSNAPMLYLGQSGDTIRVTHNLFLGTTANGGYPDQDGVYLCDDPGPMTHVTVDSNTFNHCGNGLFQSGNSGLDHMLLTNNSFVGCFPGVNMAHLNVPTITGNTFTNCYDVGMQIGTLGGVVSGNTFTGTIGYTSGGVVLGYGLDLFGGQWGAWTCSNLNVTGNTFTNNLQGVHVRGGVGPNTSITGNTFSGNATTIWLRASGGITTYDSTNVLYPNTVNDTGIGLDINGITTNLSLGAMSFPSALTQYIVLENGATANVDATAATFDGLTGAQMSGNQRVTLESKIFDKLDNAALGLVSVLPSSVSVVYVSGSYNSDTGGWGFDHFNTIQAGVNAVAPGGTVNVAAGTYAENVTIGKQITLNGSGTGTIIQPTVTSSPGVTLTTGGTSAISRMVIENLRITGVSGSSGISVTGGAGYLTFANLSVDHNGTYGITLNDASPMTDVVINNSHLDNNTSTGLKIATTVPSLTNLQITNGSMDNNVNGIYGDIATDGSRTVLDNVAVTGTTFNNNSSKGIYLERLSHATFNGITVNGSGWGPSGPPAGIDINLKYANYSGITFQNSTITNCGTGAAAGAGLTVKGRNDASYAGNPASLSGLSIIHTAISGCPVDLSIGNKVLDTNISGGCSIAGTGKGIVLSFDAGGTATLGDTSLANTLSSYIENGTPANIDATFATFGGLRGSQMTPAQLVDVENKIIDKNDNSTLGLVNVGGSAVGTLSLNPAAVMGGASSSGAITLIGHAPNGGVVVTLHSDNAAAVVQATVTVLQGETTAAFTVTTSPTATQQTANITATVGGTIVGSAVLTINPAVLQSLSINPSTVLGGTSSSGTVTLTGAAPTGGAEVTLSSNSAAGVVPAVGYVTVAAGAKTATFTITTSAVTGPTTATITASYGGVTLTPGLTINPAVLQSLSLNPTTVMGRTSSSGTVTLTAAAPAGGADVTLTSDSGAGVVPDHVTVAGGAKTASFSITTSAVTTATPVTITAILGAVTLTRGLTINPAVLQSLSLNPTTVIGGKSSSGTVTLTAAAPAGGAEVTLSSSNGAGVVPVSVTVAAGAKTATFTITTSTVTTATPVTITATLGAVTLNQGLTINPAVLQSLSLNPTTVIGGKSSSGTVTLTGAAPTGGAEVTLSSSNGAGVVPVSVTVAAGAKTATFTITANTVTTATPVTITATLGAVTLNQGLTINPAVLESLSLNPTTVIGGKSSSGTVTLTGAAPAGGAEVALSSDPGAGVPASVTVPAGAKTATFTITTSAVPSSTTATITATYGAVKASVLTIKPAS